MDQQAASYETTDPAFRDAVAMPPFRAVTPFGPAALALSLVAIAAAAITVCCLLAVIAVLILVAWLGVDGLTDFYQEWRFDIPLQTRVGAAVVSALYIGVASATVALAALRGRRAWMSLVALAPVRLAWTPVVVILAITLSYAGLATFAMARMQDRHLMASGPTDLLLVGTIVANLVVLAPIAEELLFRGWIYTALRARFAFVTSFTLTALLFAAIHWDANHRRFVLVLPLAVALGLLRELTGSIKPTIALHAVYNLIIVAITLVET